MLSSSFASFSGLSSHNFSLTDTCNRTTLHITHVQCYCTLLFYSMSHSYNHNNIIIMLMHVKLCIMFITVLFMIHELVPMVLVQYNALTTHEIKFIVQTKIKSSGHLLNYALHHAKVGSPERNTHGTQFINSCFLSPLPSIIYVQTFL